MLELECRCNRRDSIVITIATEEIPWPLLTMLDE